jgi:hypothetical protein
MDKILLTEAEISQAVQMKTDKWRPVDKEFLENVCKITRTAQARKILAEFDKLDQYNQRAYQLRDMYESVIERLRWELDETSSCVKKG